MNALLDYIRNNKTVLARNLLRAAAGGLMTAGWIDRDTAQLFGNPMVVTVAGAVLYAGVDSAYLWIKSRGGRT